MTRHGLEELNLDHLLSSLTQTAALQNIGPSRECTRAGERKRLAGEPMSSSATPYPKTPTATSVKPTEPIFHKLPQSFSPLRRQSHKSSSDFIPRQEPQEQLPFTPRPIRWASSLQETVKEKRREDLTADNPPEDDLPVGPASQDALPSEQAKEMERLTETLEALTPHDVTSYSSFRSVPGSPKTQSAMLGDPVAVNKQRRRQQAEAGARIYELFTNVEEGEQ